jgi:trk system potassium uptake protein TrkA
MAMNVIAVGGGKVGAHLAKLLLSQGHNVKIIEARPEKVDSLAHAFPAEMIFSGSGSDPAILETAGISGAQVVAAVTGSDETNLTVASLARFEFRVPRIIARVNDPRNTWLFTSEMGVDVYLNQADLIAHLVAEEMSLGDMMTLLKLRRGQYSLVEEKVHPASFAAGKSISQLNLPRESVLAAIIRKGELVIPRGDVVLQPADEIIALVHSQSTQQLSDILSGLS